MNKIVSFLLPDPPEPRLVRQIRQVSKPMELITTLVLVGMCCIFVTGIAALFFYQGPLLRIDDSAVYIFFTLEEAATEPQTMAISDLSLYTRTGMFVILLLQYGPLLMVLRALKMLFSQLKTQPVFAVEHANILWKMGIWLIVFSVIPAFTDLIAEAVGSPDRNWFKYSSIGAILLGGLLMVLAHIMRHGSIMEQENASFL